MSKSSGARGPGRAASASRKTSSARRAGNPKKAKAAAKSKAAPKTTKKPDRRGTPRGKGTVSSKNGRIGNPPFKPTAEQRDRVIALIAGAPGQADAGATQEIIAEDLGISVKTLQRHFRKELDTGTNRALTRIGGSMMAKALAGDHDSQKYVLARRGGWKTTTALEHGGKDGGPIEYRNLSDEEIDARINELTGGNVSAAGPPRK